MLVDPRSTRLTIVCTALVLAGCGSDTATPPAIDEGAPAEVALAHAPGAMTNGLSASEIAHALQALRAQTAAWHNPDKAAEAGYTLAVGCTDERTEGLPASLARGMGYHTLNPALVDGEAHLLDPELIVYARNPANGAFRFAGFDYFIPGDFYPGPASPDYPGEPPILQDLGTPLMWNDAHGGWIGHIWPWLHNPDGMFENFNPNVPLCECEITPETNLCTP
jgi:hypothetical protein